MEGHHHKDGLKISIACQPLFFRDLNYNVHNFADKAKHGNTLQFVTQITLLICPLCSAAKMDKQHQDSQHFFCLFLMVVSQQPQLEQQWVDKEGWSNDHTPVCYGANCKFHFWIAAALCNHQLILMFKTMQAVFQSTAQPGNKALFRVKILSNLL